MSMPFRLPRIYPITDKELANKTTHLAILKELARAGATLVQIRDKQTPLRDLILDLHHCVEYAERHGITLIVNDRCDLALSCGAAGVHLGQEDLPPSLARTILGKKKIIGFSTHSLPQLRRASDLPVQYLGFGPIFATTTKPDASPALGISKLRIACSQGSKPIVAIGGIKLAQIPEVLAAGAASVAIIGDLMTSGSIANRLELLMKHARGRG